MVLEREPKAGRLGRQLLYETYCDLPVPAFIEGALRLGGSLFFLGRIVSLLGFRRKLPSARPEAALSALPMVACATDGTVSVSTVMLRNGGSARDRFESEDSEGFEEMVCGRCVDAERCSCILPFFAFLSALSLPLSVLLLLLSLALELRSSVILDELTSLRSSSEFLNEADEDTKLERCVSEVCGCGRNLGSR